jgi:UDP-glucose 4-epimerase
MRSLVTGGAGFIGSHLVDTLLNSGHKVKVIDNLATGKLANLPLDNPNLEFHQCDVESDQISALFEDVNFVFHLAALADIVPSINQPTEYFRVNVGGTIKVLEAIRKHDIKKVVYAASSSCYGLPNIFPTPETTAAAPMYPYALSKYIGEQLLFHWEQVYGISTISLRLFNVYGIRARTSGSYGAVLGVFMGQLLNRLPLTIVGDGLQKRDFVHVEDVVRAFIMASLSNETHSVINIGSGTPITVQELADSISEYQIYLPKRPGEPDLTHADIRKAERLLDWKPCIDFATGLRMTIGKTELWKDAPPWTEAEISKITSNWFKYLSDK